jgi:N utilization substance protein B
MASNRHLGRIIALQTLYEYDFRRELGDDSAILSEIFARNYARYADRVDDEAFVKDLVSQVAADAKTLDQTIQPLAPEWPLAQISLIDHEILRMAVYELAHLRDKVPPKVAINEAVELAKSFGAENSSRFVNGVLGSFIRKQQPDQTKGKPDAK